MAHLFRVIVPVSGIEAAQAFATPNREPLCFVNRHTVFTGS